MCGDFSTDKSEDAPDDKPKNDVHERANQLVAELASGGVRASRSEVITTIASNWRAVTGAPTLFTRPSWPKPRRTGQMLGKFLPHAMALLLGNAGPTWIMPTRIGPGKKSVGKVLGRKRAVLPNPLTRQLRRQQDRLALKGRTLI